MTTIGDVDRNVTITFIGRDQASRAMSSIGSSASRTSKIVGGLTKALKYAALAASAALAAGALLAAKALYSATKAAYYDDIAMKKLAETQMRAQDATKAQAQATADFIDKMELATGIADDDLRPAMENLALTGMSVKKSQDQLSLAADIAIAKNVSLTSASSALAKAYNGQLSGLSRLGIKTTDAAGEALSFAEVQKLLRERFEGAARAAGKTDPLKRLEAAYNQVKEELGEGFLPLLRRFAKYVINVVVPYVKQHLVPAVKEFTDWIKDVAVPYIEQRILPAAKKFADRFRDDLWPAIQDVWEQTRKLIVKVAELTGNFDKAEEGGDGWVSAFNSVADSIETMTNILRPVVDLLNQVTSAFQWIEDHAPAVSQAMKTAVNPVGAGIDFLQNHNPFSAKGGWLHRAAGGYAGKWTMVGEHGPELINNRGFVKPHSASMGGGGGGYTIVNNYYAPQDPVSVGREMQKALLGLKRANGGTQLGLA